ncbi:MAG: MBL fold metallo-hydrolase [Pseudomonadales bacterium]|nr:MBL fold metallo-hydrolase [Pseudomonadales bacterium]
MQGFEPGIPTPIEGIKTSVQRILGRNPGPMTGPGTNSYLIGEKRLCLVDPGPINNEQYESFVQAIGDRELEYILATHTHGDHSPGAARLHETTGAKLVGLPAPEGIAQDKTFQPDQLWQDGDEIDCGEYTVRLIQTPGHVSNHICYLLVEDGFLFTGDHVLQGTTSVILPPDGDMGSYLDSLRRLQELDLRYLAPGHGGVMDKPYDEIKKLIAHRLMREEKVVAGLQKLGECSIDELVLTVYDDVAEHLIPWAKKTLLAHLIKLQRDERIVATEIGWKIV